MKTLALLAALLATSATAAPPAFDVMRFAADTKELSSDAFEGRGPATPAEAKTVAWITAKMQAAGLKPGNKGQWTQDVPLLKSNIVGTPAVTLTADGTPLTLAQGEQIAIRAALTGQDAVDIKDAPLVFVGYGVKAPERNWDDFKGVDLKGKIMVVLINDPDFDGGEGDFGGKAMTYYGRWTYKYEEAARQGAAGVLVVHDFAAASYGWATVKNSNTNTMLDIVRADPKASHTQMEGWIQQDVTAALFKASGLDLAAMKAGAKRRDFVPVVLKATLSARYQVKPEQIVSKNVIGILPGAKHPQETVIYSGHWDHLGIGAPDATGDRIYNGAIDNASGIAMVLELARAFAKAPRTDRSVAFLAVTAEEKGLLGSEYYAANPVLPLATTVGVLNLDSTIGAGAARDFSTSGSAKVGLLDLLVAEGRKAGRAYSPDPKPEAGHFYRSDHFPMAKRGVPAVSFEPGRDLLTGGRARGDAVAEAYTKDRYHQPADQWRDDLDLGNVAPDLTLLYTVGRDLVESRAWPEWSADSEFKAARDASRAARR